MNGSEDHDLLIKVSIQLEGLSEQVAAAERREIERMVRTELTVEKLDLTVIANSNRIAFLEARPISLVGEKELDRLDTMWSIYTVGRFVIPFLLLIQPVLIVLATWAIGG